MTSASPQEVDHLRERVSLYLLVMLIIDVGAYVSDAVAPLFLEELQVREWPLGFTIVRWGITVALAAGWAFARFTRPGRRTLVALEGGLTLGLVLIEVPLGLAYPWAEPQNAPAFVFLAIALLLVVRSSLVPSPVARTVAIGLPSFAWVILGARSWLGALSPTALDALIYFGGAFVVATAATSHVIYGLRRQVREAMRLGQYELGRKLGEGGMGEVYEATHIMLRRPTAVKLLPVEKAGEETIARFEREVRQTSRLEHPNSVSIYDYGRTPEGQFYYAMELVDGLTLQELVAIEGALGAARAAHILRQAAHALAEAHSLGLVHRDLKPANIMLCERAQVPDTVKVLDFGLVKATATPELDGQLTHANAVVGTPHYLAPEAISDPEGVGAASDVYALGAIGYFLVTAREVFTGGSLVEVCSKHLSAVPEPPSAVLGRPIDPGFEVLIQRCLEKDPDERPQDGAALADAINQLSLDGWTVEDARAWWQELAGKKADAMDVEPAGITQLTVDMDRRR